MNHDHSASRKQKTRKKKKKGHRGEERRGEYGRVCDKESRIRGSGRKGSRKWGNR